MRNKIIGILIVFIVVFGWLFWKGEFYGLRDGDSGRGYFDHSVVEEHNGIDK